MDTNVPMSDSGLNRIDGDMAARQIALLGYRATTTAT
jgi:hypothetical protein